MDTTDDMNSVEHDRLESIASDSWYARGANAVTIQYSARVFSRFFRGKSCLELGPAEGLMSETLASAFPSFTMVDGSKAFCEKLRTRYPHATVVTSLFEDYSPEQEYDTIVLGHVLEHVENPRAILSAARNWLAPSGVLLAAVPNARSLHRQAAVKMGLLSSIYDLNEADLHHGHRRVYDSEQLRADFEAAGLTVKEFGGYWLKPLSNQQLEESFTPEMFDAFMELGEDFPDIAGELYVVAER